MIFSIPFEYRVSKGAKKTKWSGNRVALSARYRNAKHNAHMTALVQAREVGWKPIPKGTGVVVKFFVHFPSGVQRDPINYTECLLDALEGVAYDNDSQVIDSEVHFEGYDKENPRIVVGVNEANRPIPLPPSRQPKSRRQPKVQ